VVSLEVAWLAFLGELICGGKLSGFFIVQIIN